MQTFRKRDPSPVLQRKECTVLWLPLLLFFSCRFLLQFLDQNSTPILPAISRGTQQVGEQLMVSHIACLHLSLSECRRLCCECVVPATCWCSLVEWSQTLWQHAWPRASRQHFSNSYLLWCKFCSAWAWFGGRFSLDQVFRWLIRWEVPSSRLVVQLVIH